MALQLCHSGLDPESSLLNGVTETPPRVKK